MLNDLYNKKILALAADIPRLGHLDKPDATTKAHSRLCGSTVVVELSMADGLVADFAHEVRACALGQASSSIMARHIVGSSPDELRDIRRRMIAMLKEGGAADFSERWEDLNILEPVRDFKARHASTLLTFDAVVSALDQVATGETASV